MEQPRSGPSGGARERIETYRHYLRFLARTGMNPKLRARVDPSDIVQETLMEALKALATFEPRGAEAEAAWLRQILARNLANAARDNLREKRDVSRERSIEASLAESSLRLGSWLAADQSTPSAQVERKERAFRLAAALADLPHEQSEALILQHWHGWSMEEIGEHLSLSRFAVGRLIRKALSSLRDVLKETEEA